MMPIEDGKYKIILEEASYLWWEGSFMDYVRLKDEEGKECKLIEAEHSKNGNVLSLLKYSDDFRAVTKPTEKIGLIFTECSGNDFTLTIEGYNPLRGGTKLSLTFLHRLIEYLSGLLGLRR
jgi:hypothetical protein